MRESDEWDAEIIDHAGDDVTSEDLDEQFPLGDGVADLMQESQCPYCGEAVEITLDPGSGDRQEYVEDCMVCCRPWNVSVTYHADGTADVFLEASDDQ